MTDKVVIIGTSTFADIVATYFNEYNAGEIVAFACSSEFKYSDEHNNLPLVDFDELFIQFPPKLVKLFVAIGYRKMNSIRQTIFEKFDALGYEFVTFVHPDVKIWKNSVVGRNCFIFEDNTIQPFTSIGDNTILWSGNHVGHHSAIGSHTFISSHVVISGSCKIGNNVFIGVNTSVHDQIEIGDRALIGAGAIIGRNIEPDAVVSPLRTKISERKSFEVDF